MFNYVQLQVTSHFMQCFQNIAVGVLIQNTPKEAFFTGLLLCQLESFKICNQCLLRHWHGCIVNDLFGMCPCMVVNNKVELFLIQVFVTLIIRFFLSLHKQKKFKIIFFICSYWTLVEFAVQKKYLTLTHAAPNPVIFHAAISNFLVLRVRAE